MHSPDCKAPSSPPDPQGFAVVDPPLDWSREERTSPGAEKDEGVVLDAPVPAPEPDATGTSVWPELGLDWLVDHLVVFQEDHGNAICQWSSSTAEHHHHSVK